MRRILLVLAVTACSADQSLSPQLSPSSPNFDSKAPVHSVTGTGRVNVAPGFSYSSTIAVHQDANGRVWGVVNTHIIDLSLHGVPGKAEIQQEPECMRVVGNTAYVGLIITKSSNPAVGAVGDRSVLWVQDNGSRSPDLHHGGPAAFLDPSNLICTTTPPRLPETPVSQGNFSVR